MTAVGKAIGENKGIALLTTMVMAVLLLGSLLGAPGVYAYNEYTEGDGSEQTKNAGGAAAAGGGAMATAGGALATAGEAAGSSAMVAAGGAAATGGAVLAVAGATALA